MLQSRNQNCRRPRSLMPSRPGPLPSGSGWSFELKWDGFRALVSTEQGLAVRSRRGWDMTPVLPELRALPDGLVLDGELVAWKGSEPYFPLVPRTTSRSPTKNGVLALRTSGDDPESTSVERERTAKFSPPRFQA